MATDSELTSSLVLVAPMPRRPIALVARRQPAHQSRSKAARVSSQSGTTQQSAAPLSSAAQSVGAETISSRSHPYSRAKTPVGGSIGLAMSPTILPLAGDKAVSMGHARRRSSTRNIDALDSTAQLPAAINALSMSAPTKDEPMVSAASAVEQPAEKPDVSEVPMVTSPVQRPAGSLAAAGRTLSDVDRTPTKKALRQMVPQLSPEENAINFHQGSPDNAVPDELLALSPSLPSTQRLGPAFSSPRSLISATMSAANNADSNTSSPSLSESQSRSPSSSPSPCPSPSFADDMRSYSPRLASDWSHGDEHDASSHAYSSAKDMIPLLLSQRRKLGLPLPIPTSPIPRKMTRNPFERSLNLQEQLTQWCDSAERINDQVMADQAAARVDMQDE